MAGSMMTFTTLLLNILRLSFVVPRRPVPANDPQILCGEFETVCTVGLCDIPGCDQCTLDVADCTTGNVSEPIPQTLHHTIEWLALRYHGLPISLDGSMFAKFTHLSVLKLYGNFSSLKPGTFTAHHRLTLLHISDSYITELPDFLFPDPDANHLHKLHLPYNRLTRVPENLFHQLKRIRSIDLSYNPIQLCDSQTIGDRFRTLPYLQTLSLAGIGRNATHACNFSNGFLAPLAKIDALDFSESNILQHNEFLLHALDGVRIIIINNMDWYKSCPARASALFKNLPATINTINARSWRTNQLVDRECVLNSTSLANLRHLRKLSLSFRYSDGILGDSITSELFAGLQLQELDISWCRITHIADGAFDSVYHIARLGLTGNQLGVNTIKLFSTYSKGYRLRDLTLGSAGLFSDSNLEYNIGDVLQISPNISQLILNQNMMEDLPKFAASGRETTDSVVPYYKTTVLCLDGNRLKYLSTEATQELCSLMPLLGTFSAKSNMIVDSTGLCPSIHNLDLSDNHIGQYSERNLEALKHLENLNILVMARNGIRELPLDMVKKMPDLQNFMMAGNGIRIIPRNFFSNNPRISHLDLSANELVAVDINMFESSNELTNIYLQGNLITNISQEIAQRLDDLATKHHLQMLNILGNPFDCTCDTHYLQNWIVNSSVIANVKNISCQGTDEPRKGAEVYNYKYTKFYCVWRLPLTIAGIILLGILFSSPLVLYTYKHRWYLCHIRVVFRAMVRSAKKLKREGLSKYDAFVSYDADNDQVCSWIVDNDSSA